MMQTYKVKVEMFAGPADGRLVPDHLQGQKYLWAAVNRSVRKADPEEEGFHRYVQCFTDSTRYDHDCCR